MNLQDWLKIIDDEYFKEYVQEGGSAVKFLVPNEAGSNDKTWQEIEKVAKGRGYAFAFLDSANTRIHLIDRIFHEVARQTDWDGLAYQFVLKIFADNGYELPQDRDSFSLNEIALLNEREEKLLRKDMKSWLEMRIYRDYAMSQEFRIAMIRLCLAQLEPEGASPFLTNAIKEWLRGELPLISSLKEALIYQKINRYNARYMLFSLAHWLKLNGAKGLILVFDISRYTVTARTRDQHDGFYYSVPATLDVYEVLRQFIDGTDEMESCFLAVIASKSFLTDERRGVGRYDALKLRIWDEVRDKHRENPFSSLIRIS